MGGMGEIRLSKRLLHMPEFANITEADIVRIFGTPEERAKEAARMDADYRFLRTKKMEAEFPGEHVAVLNCKVVAHASSYDALRRELQAKGMMDAGAMVREIPRA